MSKLSFNAFPIIIKGNFNEIEAIHIFEVEKVKWRNKTEKCICYTNLQ